MGMTSYFQAQVLGLLTGSYVALHTGDPGPTGAGNQLADANYVREAVTLTSPSDGDGDNVYQISNSAEVAFPALAAGTTLYYFSLWDAATAGNCLLTVPLSSSKVLSVGGVARFPIGELIVKGVIS